jgi:hypothetical protein
MSQVQDRDAEFLYITIPKGYQGSSAARAIEAAMIKEFVRRSIPLTSTWDMATSTSPA